MEFMVFGQFLDTFLSLVINNTKIDNISLKFD